MGVCSSKEPQAPATQTTATAAKRTQQQQKLQANGDAISPPSALKQQNGSQESSREESSSKEQEKQSVESPEMLQTSDKELKVLLLGSGESGKSTIVKQMKILHKNGFSESEAYEYKPFVYKNVLDCVKNVINAIIDLQPDLIAPEGSQPEANGQEPGERKHILNYDDLNAMLDYELSVSTEEAFSPSIAQKIKDLYNLPEVKEFIKLKQGDFYLIDSTHYFLSEIDRIAAPDYIPSQSDILRTRKKTSGIFDFRFQMGGLNIHMFDVGGQRSERKKWIHCFDNVTLIIFCVALSEYDQVLLEENSQNRLEESLTLFDSVVNSRWFSRTSVVLFLNKIDVFASKLPYSPLERHFPDYNGGDNINKAVKYILWRFTQVNRSGLNIYPHVTQATDTSNIQLVFAAVKETILENSLRDSGIL
ncbi:CIC11C00000005915 [Sungouiella intermedia]|uniref:CIC11C00000004572 n=1 Tax=Sungouiella intermedia TaxID=45354 RepID=A0A1L0BI38_9ASCO|nr:CIC11C00000005915 [[Candida] intermedia]SGZ51215.1 CIC11C00000004572 [[Candida] intermedia]